MEQRVYIHCIYRSAIAEASSGRTRASGHFTGRRCVFACARGVGGAACPPEPVHVQVDVVKVCERGGAPRGAAVHSVAHATFHSELQNARAQKKTV